MKFSGFKNICKTSLSFVNDRLNALNVRTYNHSWKKFDFARTLNYLEFYWVVISFQSQEFMKIILIE